MRLLPILYAAKIFSLTVVVLNCFQNLQSNAEIFSQLLNFIKDAHKTKGVSYNRQGMIKEIPTAAFITGKKKIYVLIFHLTL